MKQILFYLILIFANTIGLAQVNYSPQEIATQQYFNFSIERLKNTEEYLERLSYKIEAGQVEAAKENYIKAHYQYESIRPLILLFPNLNSLVDKHFHQLPKATDSLGFMGFHALEYELFMNNDSARAFVETQKLINNIRFLIKFMQQQEITYQNLMNILPAFTQQMKNKLSGQDSSYSESSLGEIAANMEGIQLIINQTQDLLPQNLLFELNAIEDTIYLILDRYKFEDIHLPFSDLKSKDKAELHTETQHLNEILMQLSPLPNL